MMDKLERYNRQMILPGFGREKQQLLLKAKVLMIGAGGLGCPAMLYLAAAGVGHLGIVDFDRVEISNLHRQVLYNESDIGKPKAEVAAEKIKVYNQHIRVEVFDTRLSTDNALEIIAGYDLVIDGSDNFPTRYIVNDACVLLDIPLIYASIYRFEGQVAVFNLSDANGGSAKTNYRDLFPNPPGEDEIPNCAEAGVLGVLPGIMGSLQANEAIKIITRLGQPLINRLLTFNALTSSFYEFEISPNANNSKQAPQTKAEFKGMDYIGFCTTQEEEVNEILPEDFDSMARNSNIMVIDVRNEQELPKLEGYPILSIPLPDLSERMKELEDGGQILFLCQSGVRSRTAALMAKKEYSQKQIFSLRGGIIALKNFETLNLEH